MNPMSRNVLAAAVASAVALGVTAPAAAVGPKDRPGGVVKVAKPDKGTEKAGKLADKIAKQVEKAAEKAAEKSGGGSTVKTSVAGKDAPKVTSKSSARGKKPAKLKAGKAERMFAKLQRRLTKEAVKKERYLTRLVASKKVTRLPQAQQTTVISSNISADLSELADLRAAIASGEDLRGVAKDLRALRPEVYNVILNQLRLAEKLRTELGVVEEPATDEPATDEPATDVPTTEEPAGPEPVATVTAEDGSEEPAETNEDPADAPDEPAVDEPVDDLAPAADEASLDAVVAKLLTFNARTTRVELRATQRALSQIKDALEDDGEAEDDADEDDADEEDAEDDDAAEDDAADDDEPVAGTPVISS